MPNAKKSATRKTKSSSIATTRQLLALRLRALRDVETEGLKSLKQLTKKASDEKLIDALIKIAETQEDHKEQLTDLIENFEESAPAIRIQAIRGMGEDGSNILNLVEKGPALDASIILELQYQAHYSMAGYGTARAWAELLEESNIVEVLDTILAEKEEADQETTALAEEVINPQIPSGDERVEDEEE